MIKENVRILGDNISGERAFNTISKLTTFHRIQGSDGYKDAVKFCQLILEKEGISTEVINYDSNEREKHWTNTMNKAWNCKEGYLDLTYPTKERLCDFSTNCNSVMARSGSIDHRNDEVEIVLMDRGIEEEAYGDIDFKGKIIFVDTDYKKFKDWAVEERGAIGIIAERMWDMDGFRTKGEMEDARQSMGLAWNDEENDNYIFGYVLTSRQADKLRIMCKNIEKEHLIDNTKPAYARVKCFIDAKIFDGVMEDVVAIVPGQTDEEIIMVSHLCHPKTSANDNASGVAGTIEILTTINRLIKEGKLEKPRRSIKLILMPEFSGTYAYLSNNENLIPKMKCGINLDMIGGSQKNNGCCTVITDVPHAYPSFVHDVACMALDVVKQDSSMVNEGDIPLYNYKPIDFVPQSDHFVYSDPSVGVPMLMMLQWPDKYYHTSADTIEKIEPEMLKRNATIAAGYVYSIANLKMEEIPSIFNKLNERLVYKITNKIREAKQYKKSKKFLEEEKEYYKTVYCNKANDIKRFFTEAELQKLETLLARENKLISSIVYDIYNQYISGIDYKEESECIIDKKYRKIPVKQFRGPISPYGYFSQVRGKEKAKLYMLMDKYDDVFEICDFVTYWADGNRSIWDIVNNIRKETNVDLLEFSYDYLTFLNELGAIEFKTV